MSFSMTLETRDGVDLAFKIFQFTELVPDRLRASVMVVAPARLFEDALAGHVGDRGGVRGGDGGHGEMAADLTGVIFSTERVLSAELDTECLGGMSATLRVFLGLLGEEVFPD